MGKLDGKVACITGGTRSIGRGMAEAFLREGAKVVVNGRGRGKGSTVPRRRWAPVTTPTFFAGDMCQAGDVEGLIDFTIDHFGQLDICCLNSGGVLQTAPVAQMTRRGVEARGRLEPQPRLLGHAAGAAAHDPARKSGGSSSRRRSRASSASRASRATRPRKHAVNGLVEVRRAGGRHARHHGQLRPAGPDRDRHRPRAPVRRRHR